jgi:site-specific DNA recombinase
MAKLNEVIINPDKVAIYVRWSTEEQTSGTTLEVQLNADKNYVLSQGWNVNEDLIFIDNGFTGANLNRPDMIKLRRYIKEGKIDCVIVYKLDRLSRSLRDAVNLVMDEWLDVAYIKSVNEPIDTTQMLGRQIFYILMGFAEMERDVIRERTQSGKLIRAKEGKNAGFRIPYGYTNELGNPGNFILIPEEKLIIRKMIEMYKNRKGVRTITETLNINGLLNRGKYWNNSTIFYILRNPFYYGQLIYGRHSQDSRWIEINDPISSVVSKYIEPIMTKEEFDELQEIRKSKNVNRSGVSGRTYLSQHLLTGLLFCKNCGHALGGLKPSTGRKYFYYACKGYHCKGKNFCDAAYIQQNLIDDIVVNDIKNNFIPKTNRKTIINLLNTQYSKQIKEVINSINQLENNRATIVKQLSSAEQDYLKGDLNAKLYGKLDDRLNIELMNLELVIKEKQDELKNLEMKTVDVEEINDFAEDMLEWDNKDIGQKKNLLNKWVKKVTVYKKKGTDDLHLDIDYIWDKNKADFTLL